MAVVTHMKCGEERNTERDDPAVVLLVDNDPDCLALIGDAVSQAQVSTRVFRVDSGFEALDFVNGRGRWEGAPRPELIYLDMEMPGMSGVQTLRRVRADAELRDIPIVMMTGVSEELEMLEAANAGANSYTVKSSNAEELHQTVLLATEYWLRVHQSPQRHVAQSKCRR